MFTTNPNQQPVTLQGRSPSASREGARVSLDQIDEALAQYASDPTAAAVLLAAESIRGAAAFLDSATAKVGEILKSRADAIETASDVAKANVPIHGFNSPSDREAVIATSSATIADAFWKKAVAEVIAARQNKADKLADDAIVALEGAKLRIANAHAKLALPLTMRLRVDADTKAQIDQLAVELSHDKPSAIEQLVRTHKGVGDEERATLILMAVGPMILGYLENPPSLERFRIGGNLEVEAAASGRLKQLLADARRAEIPRALLEAEAGYKRLLPLFGVVFGRRVTPEDLRASKDWLEVGLGSASTFTTNGTRK